MSTWYQLDSAEVLGKLGSNASSGLNRMEAARRLAEQGPNELQERGSKNPWLILWEQLIAPLVVILLVAAVVSASLGDYKEAMIIFLIVVLNALLGFNQEYRAEKAMAALKALAVPIVKVRREGRWQELSATELVVGDIVRLEAGNLVPADIRLLETANLRTQEASLTGESEPVDKISSALIGNNLPIGDRYNMAYMGTMVVYGRGQGIVTATGMNTELGKIAKMLQAVSSGLTPLQQRLEQLGKGLVTATLVLVFIIFILGLLRGEELQLMFLTTVSIAVAAVPEGLPAVVTIALALGSQRMLKRGALIRQLPAVETLGSVTTICSDKTGTLTENRMTVSVLDVVGRRLELTSYLPKAFPWLDVREEIPQNLLNDQPELALLLTGGSLCNDAQLEAIPERSYCFQIVGEPTEGALVMAAARLGLWKAELESFFPRVAEVPFDAQRKCMTTIHQFPLSSSQLPSSLQIPWQWYQQMGKLPYIGFTKGAVDSLLEICSEVWVNDRPEVLTEVWRDYLITTNNELAQQGTRVLGVAFRPGLSARIDGGKTWERDLIFIGLVGMSDPVRKEVQEAVQTCINAGIRPVMITGDHPLTARYIARKLGIAIDGKILTGQDLANLSVRELEKQVEAVSVYARVTPEHKLNIVRALQHRGQIVAMTGDGVNDAPALKQADIGVAMGVTGTDVAKEAADMALLDDDFATIVAAVKQGRIIYDNIRKFIKYMLSSNTGEIWVMLVAPFLGMPLPLLPLQILWINLTTDGLPALALGVEPAERHVMSRPPYSPKEKIFSRGLGWNIIWVGILMGLVSLGTGYWYWLHDYAGWQTIVFTVLTLSQMGNALAIRSERDSLFQIGLLSNQPLLGAVALTLGLQLAVIYVPLLQQLFHTKALSLGELFVCLALSTVVFWSVELEKWLFRRRLWSKKSLVIN
ncbi:MAG: cation-translocating P-type ATPase [Xenococcaceae cyanobacterium MO_188.B29]|nr:cation-translocating P-type ATPase [Xenococcaceae cyanobacterium MO_188.B29]